MNKILSQLYDFTPLSDNEACDAMKIVVSAGCPESHSSAFVSAYMMRKPSVPELSGFRRALMDLCTPVSLSQAAEAVDIVGTGGDGKNTFNISTLTAVVTAAAGVPVIKHGNYGVSSMSGSSNVLEQLGYRFTDAIPELQSQLDRFNLCFLHAPLFHPAMKHIAPVRRSLGVRSFFNLLGPLCNPAGPGACMLGANSLETSRIYQYMLPETPLRYAVVHSLDGHDEISLTGDVKICTPQREVILTPGQLGFTPVDPRGLNGGQCVSEAAEIFMNILSGTGTSAQKNVVIANSAMAIQTARPATSYQDNIALVREVLEAGKAHSLFKQLLEHSYEHS